MGVAATYPWRACLDHSLLLAGLDGKSRFKHHAEAQTC